ncbi:MAG: homocysteine S-methyltransferase family protein [Myxococcales bacterium]|nr:homocysteine S-methyltransferase family protein [Myxococcales bacterium]
MSPRPPEARAAGTSPPDLSPGPAATALRDLSPGPAATAPRDAALAVSPGPAATAIRDLSPGPAATAPGDAALAVSPGPAAARPSTRSPDRAPILLDGATGTELERRGARMTAPLWSAHALLEAPDVVRQIHLDYLRAGAQVLTTNSFRTHAQNLAAAGLERRAAELTRTSVALARAAREQHAAESPRARETRIAGAISPIADCFRPEHSPGEAALPAHRAIATQLAEAGCDLLLAETFGRVDEARAAVSAAQGLGLPIWLAVVARPDAHLLSGDTLNSLIAALEGLELAALLINCTDLQHLPAALPALLSAAEARPDLALGLYPHTGHNDPVHGWQTHATDAITFADSVTALVDAHPRLSLVGACCGSTPDWISALSARLHPTPQHREAATTRLTAAVPRRG